MGLGWVGSGFQGVVGFRVSYDCREGLCLMNEGDVVCKVTSQIRSRKE